MRFCFPEQSFKLLTNKDLRLGPTQMGQSGLKRVVLMCVPLVAVIQGGDTQLETDDLAAHTSTCGDISYEPGLLCLQG